MWFGRRVCLSQFSSIFFHFSFPFFVMVNNIFINFYCFLQQIFFSQLFGQSDPDDDVSPETVSNEVTNHTNGNGIPSESISNGTSSINASAPTNNEEDSSNRLSTRQYAERINYEPKQLFDKVFLLNYNTGGPS